VVVRGVEEGTEQVVAFVDNGKGFSCLKCGKRFPQAGRIAEQHLSACYKTPEQKKMQGYMNLKRSRGRTGRGATWNLTEKQVWSLLDEAGISILDVGKTKGKYQLARYDDTGPYEIGNCRFILQYDNIQEQWTDEFRKKRIKQIRAENRSRDAKGRYV